MTDKDIIKALKLCIDDEYRCDECPYIGIQKEFMSCGKMHGIDLLNLINHQKAEIERLKKACEEAVDCFNRMESLYRIKCVELKVAKAEALKEFAERLKETKFKHSNEYIIYAENIDTIVNEMVGE